MIEKYGKVTLDGKAEGRGRIRVEGFTFSAPDLSSASIEAMRWAIGELQAAIERETREPYTPDTYECRQPPGN